MQTIYFTKGIRATFDPSSFLPVAWQMYKNGTATLSFNDEQGARGYARSYGAKEITGEQYHRGGAK